MSKKGKNSKANSKNTHSNNAVECNHSCNANIANDCGKENCSCTKHNNCGTLTQGE